MACKVIYLLFLEGDLGISDSKGTLGESIKTVNKGQRGDTGSSGRKGDKGEPAVYSHKAEGSFL